MTLQNLIKEIFANIVKIILILKVLILTSRYKT
jgi:hypothetical protein